MVARVWTHEPLNMLVVDQMNDVGFLSSSDTDRLWFQIPMQVAVIMKDLQPVQHLDAYHEHGFKWKLSIAEF